MMTREVLILTKSAKHGQYCVAGIDMRTKQWIRLVSSNESTKFALSRRMLLYSNKRECQVLDVVRVHIIEDKPLQIQRENVLIDERKCFEYLGRCTVQQLEKCLNNEPYVFSSTLPYIYKARAMRLGYSLRMYKVKNLTLSAQENKDGEMRRKLSFEYKNILHTNFSMTDYQYYKAPLGKIADEAIIVVSIPEDDYNDKHYKFVAQIFV